MTISTPIEASMLRTSTMVIASGRLARGKCSARIRPRLPLIAWMPACTTDWVKPKMKTPVHRYATKLSMPFLVPRTTPKMT
jgi:hypothetical protein